MYIYIVPRLLYSMVAFISIQEEALKARLGVLYIAVPNCGSWQLVANGSKTWRLVA